MVDWKARVEDLLVLTPREGTDFVVAATSVLVGGDGARMLEAGEIFWNAEAKSLLSQATNAGDAIETTGEPVFSIKEAGLMLEHGGYAGMMEGGERWSVSDMGRHQAATTIWGGVR